MSSYLDMDYYGYIYLIILPQGSIEGIPNINGLRPYYFGQKKGGFNKNYFGSSRIIKEWLKSMSIHSIPGRLVLNTAKKLGIERHIICYAYSEQELNRLEKYFIDPVLGTLGCINLKSGGRGGMLVDTIWTSKRRQRQSRILNDYEEKLRLSQEYAGIAKTRRQRGIELAEWAKRDKIENPQKYKKLYDSQELRENFSNVQIKAWQDLEQIKKHQHAWNEDKRMSASLRESSRWTLSKRAERSRRYKEYRHWTNGVDDVYQIESPGAGWVPARLGTKKSCSLLGTPFTSEIKESAKFYFVQKNRKNRRKHNK
jgi:hypothetical protein